jgi:uncharacterized protein
MTTHPTSYISPKLEGRLIESKGGHGVFALKPVYAGEILVVWGGEIYTAEQLDDLSEQAVSLGLQLEEGLYIIPQYTGPADWVNHSCEPNAGIRGQVTVIAMRDIAPGEEVTFDYAMTDASDYDEFRCECNTPACRKRITGSDWRNPELWKKYDGYFATYIQQRIEKLKRELSFAEAAD